MVCVKKPDQEISVMNFLTHFSELQNTGLHFKILVVFVGFEILTAVTEEYGFLDHNTI
jgi:hypothetical protein